MLNITLVLISKIPAFTDTSVQVMKHNHVLCKYFSIQIFITGRKPSCTSFTYSINYIILNGRYVGNLDPSVTEELILALFGQIGPVKGCKIIHEVSSDFLYLLQSIL